jgi:hypothetical protein
LLDQDFLFGFNETSGRSTYLSFITRLFDLAILFSLLISISVSEFKIDSLDLRVTVLLIILLDLLKLLDSIYLIFKKVLNIIEILGWAIHF